MTSFGNFCGHLSVLLYFYSNKIKKEYFYWKNIIWYLYFLSTWYVYFLSTTVIIKDENSYAT